MHELECHSLRQSYIVFVWYQQYISTSDIIYLDECHYISMQWKFENGASSFLSSELSVQLLGMLAIQLVTPPKEW